MTMPRSRAVRTLCVLLLPLLILVACSEPEPALRMGDAMPIHLEDRIELAEIVGGEVPSDLRPPLRWSFSDPEARLTWKPLPHLTGGSPAAVTAEDEGLVVELPATATNPSNDNLYGGVYLELDDDFELDQWTHGLLEVRTSDAVKYVGLGYNLREEAGENIFEKFPTKAYAQGPRELPEAGLHTFRIPLVGADGPPEGPVREISVEFDAIEPTSVEVVSLTLIPSDALYATEGVGVRSPLSREHEGFGPQRRALYVHTPTRLSWPLKVPKGGRLDVGLGVFGGPAELVVELEPEDGGARTLLESTVEPGAPWDQRSVDLAEWADENVVLTLAAERSDPSLPAVAFWAAPTLSGATTARAERPNVLFYVIDGASAGLMSVYGYERPTTPNLERIAAEGVVFERAHSNSTWTMPSTASFMTSLHHSVLGGLRNDSNPVPVNVRTMAEHFHDAGLHTGVFTMNPNAAGLSGLDRGVDVVRDFAERGEGGRPLPIESVSSRVLQEQYRQWRDAYPGPYWAHFQTTDVHPPYHPPEPFGGRLVPAEEAAAFNERLGNEVEMAFNHDSASVHEHYREELEENGIDPAAFYGTMRDLHDESMMHQDHQLGELVDELRELGEWENTLLVIASDHGHPAATYPRFGRGLLDPQPPAWEGALLDEFNSHVPLIFVWPGGIEGGIRVDEPVSMIDVLPTILDLVDLPAPDVAQGRSLVPLLRGETEDWESRPVVFDEFRITDGDQLIGNLELLDRRWGMSLEIRTADQADTVELGRHPAPAGGRWNGLEFENVPRFLLYDVEQDPKAVRNITAEYPDVAETAQRRLWRIWQLHRSLAERFQASAEAELTPEQMQSLRALGYIQ